MHHNSKAPLEVGNSNWKAWANWAIVGTGFGDVGLYVVCMSLLDQEVSERKREAVFIVVRDKW